MSTVDDILKRKKKKNNYSPINTAERIINGQGYLNSKSTSNTTKNTSKSTVSGSQSVNLTSPLLSLINTNINKDINKYTSKYTSNDYKTDNSGSVYSNILGAYNNVKSDLEINSKKTLTSPTKNDDKNRVKGTTTKEGYTTTGKVYGDYIYQGYTDNKDKPIVEKDGKYYIYNENATSNVLKYTPVDNLTFLSSDPKKDYEEAVKSGYKGSKTDVSKLSNQIKLDTADLTEKEKEEYTKDILRQEAAEEKQRKQDNKVRYGGAGLKGTLGELEYLFGNAKNTIEKEVVDPVKNFEDNYETGKLNNELALEYYKKMQGKENKVDELEKKVATYNKFNEDLLTNPGATGTAIQNLNTQVESIKNQGIAATILGVGGAGIGTLINPGAGTVTGAKVGAGLGYTFGATPYTYELEAGNQYKALLDMGVPDDVAKKYAKTTGIINAGIESGENIIDLATFGVTTLTGKGASKMSKEAVNEMIDEYGESTVKTWLKKKLGEETADKFIKVAKTGVKSYGQNIVSEAAEEMLQEGTSITTERLATNEAGIEREATLKDDLSRIKEAGLDAAISSAFTGPLFSAGGAIVTNTLNTVGTKANTKVIESNVNKQIKAYEEKNGTKFTTDEKKQLLSGTLKVIEDIKKQSNTTLTEEEKALSQQQFVYESSENDSTYRQELAKSSDVLNNSTSHHELFNLAAKVAEDTNTTYRFTNDSKEEMINEKNKFIENFAKKENMTVEEAREVVNDLTIDGFVNDKGEVIINADSPKALNVILGHETTHLLEGTKEYKKLQDALFKLADTKGELNQLKENMTRLYEGTNANIDNEITSELAGEYLYTNQDFINNLAVEQPNVFQRVYNYLQHIYKTIKANSKEARQLEQVIYRYKQAYNKVSNTTTNEVKSNSLVEADSNTLNNVNKKGATLNERSQSSNISNSDSTSGIYPLQDNRHTDAIDTNIADNKENVKYSLNEKKSQEINTIDDIKEKYKDNLKILNLFENKNDISLHNIVVNENQRNQGIGQSVLNDIIKYANKVNKTITLTPTTEYGTKNKLTKWYKNNGFVDNKGKNTDFTISDTMYKKPDTKYSLTDNTGRKLSKEQQEFFKDSKVRDEEGNLLEVYHGTKTEGTNVFNYDPNRQTGTDFGKAYYFTSDYTKAQGYQYNANEDPRVIQHQSDERAARQKMIDAGFTEEARNEYKEWLDTHNVTDYINDESYVTPGGETKKIYLNLTNPLEVDAKGENYYKVYPEYFKTARENGNDGIIVKNVVDNPRGEQRPIDVYIAFENNQIKNVDNTNPTDNPDIRYSISDNKGRTLTPEQQEYFKDSKIRDEDGNLLTMYHGSNGKFTVFDLNKGGKSNSNAGIGFWFTPSQEGAKNFADSVWYGDKNEQTTFEVYLDIKNPKVYEKIDTKQQREELKTKLYDLDKEIKNIRYEYEIEDIGITNIDAYLNTYNYTVDQVVDNLVNNLRYKEEKARKYVEDVKRYSDLRKEYKEIEKTYDDLRWTDSYEQFRTDIYKVAGKSADDANTGGVGMALDNKEQVLKDYVSSLKEQGYDGIVIKDTDYDSDTMGGTNTQYVAFESNQIKNVDNTNPTTNEDIRYSLSKENDIAPVNEDWRVYGNKALEQQGIIQKEVESAIAPLQDKIQELSDILENIAPVNEQTLAGLEKQYEENFRNINENDISPVEGNYNENTEVSLKNKNEIVKDIKEKFNIKQYEARDIYNKAAAKIMNEEDVTTVEDIYNDLVDYREVKIKEQDDQLKDIKSELRNTPINIDEIKSQITDYRYKDYFGRLRISKEGQPVDVIYEEYSDMYPAYFPSDITTQADQFEYLSDFMNRDINNEQTYNIDDDTLYKWAEDIYVDVGNKERYKASQYSLYQSNKYLNDIEAPITEEEERQRAKDEQERLRIKREQEENLAKYATLDDLINAGLSDISPFLEKAKKTSYDEQIDDQLSKKKNKNKKEKVITKEKGKLRNFVDTTRNLLVNRNQEIDNLAKESGNQNIKYAGDMLNSVAGEIEGELYTAQTDNEGHEIGKSLSGIFQPLKKNGLYDAFNDYLEQYSNIDRHKQGKGSKTKLEVSQKLVKEYESLHPEFKEYANEVWNYGRNIKNNMLDSGLINQEFSDRLSEMYPHYVPFMENREMSTYYPDLKEAKPKGVIKRAKGGASNLLAIEEALTKYTFAAKKAIRQNQLYQQIVNTLDDKVSIGADVRIDPSDLTENLYRDENGNYLTAYVDGEQKSVRISDDLYKGLKNDLEQQVRDLEEKLSLVTKPLQKVSEVRRNLLTTWSPTFIITNPLKDIQDAVFNSKHTASMLKNYPGSFVELARAKNPTAKQFLTLYGSGNTQGDYSIDSGLSKGNVLKKNANFLKGISKLNNIVELAPRYAEFKASLQHGATIQEAMYNAREITTNFNRGGVITKALNRNGATFLNASVQGFDKFIRNFSGENGAKGIVSSLLKATLFGVVPAVFNELAFGGGDDEDKDEDYEALPDYIKDNYYLIKTGEGEFIRIPKGRALSVFGSAARRTMEYTQGEEDAFEGYFKNALSQVGANDPSESNIFTPLLQAKDNKAWYGGDIVPTRLQENAPAEQYDASTDKFSIWLANTSVGKKLGLSPYKINYVLDQYTGGLGDIALPLMTEEATNGAETLGEQLLAPIKDKFTANSTDDNKYASDIYSLKEKMTVKPSSVKETDEYQLQMKYLNNATTEMGKLYAERREVQADTSLSKSEKYDKVQEIQKQINSLAKEGLDNYQNITLSGDYASIGNQEYYKYTNDEGEEKWAKAKEEDTNELNSMGLDLQEKSAYYEANNEISSIKNKYKNNDDYTSRKQDIVNVIKNTNIPDEAKYNLYDKYYGSTDELNVMQKIGVKADVYMDYDSQNFTADKDKNGKSISGSKKTKVFDYINSMDNIDFEQKIILAKLQYNSYDEYNNEIINYLNNNNDITYDDMETLLKKMGFEVDSNGNIKW